MTQKMQPGMRPGMRPATEEERREDWHQRLTDLVEAHARGEISNAQYAERTAQLDAFEGYPRPDESVARYNSAREVMTRRFIASATGMPPTTEQREAVDQFQQLAIEFATAIEQLAPDGRNKSLALTHLEDALMRANRALFADGAAS